MSFEGLRGHKYLSLETFKKSGEGVKTPVWFAAAGENDELLYVYTLGVSGKVKRIRNNGSVRVAPCDMRGDVKGEWVNANAAIVQGEEAERGMRLLNKKYVPWKQILDFFARFKRQQRIIFAIRSV